MVISKRVLLGVPTVASGASLEPQKCVSTVTVPLLSIQAACEDDGVPGARFRAPPEAGRHGLFVQVFRVVGLYYTPAFIFRSVEAVRRLEQWLIENNSYQPLSTR